METPETVVPEVQRDISIDSKNMGTLMWILCLFLGFVPSLAFYLIKTDDPFVNAHAKEALNIQINVAAAGFIAGFLVIIVIGLLLLPVVSIFYMVMCIMGAIKANNGELLQSKYYFRILK